MKNYICLLLIMSSFLVKLSGQEFPISVRNLSGLNIPLFSATDSYYDKANKVLYVFGNASLESKGIYYPAVASLVYKDYRLQFKNEKSEFQYLKDDIFKNKGYGTIVPLQNGMFSAFGSVNTLYSTKTIEDVSKTQAFLGTTITYQGIFKVSEDRFVYSLYDYNDKTLNFEMFDSKFKFENAEGVNYNSYIYEIGETENHIATLPDKEGFHYMINTVKDDDGSWSIELAQLKFGKKQITEDPIQSVKTIDGSGLPPFRNFFSAPYSGLTVNSKGNLIWLVTGKVKSTGYHYGILMELNKEGEILKSEVLYKMKDTDNQDIECKVTVNEVGDIVLLLNYITHDKYNKLFQKIEVWFVDKETAELKRKKNRFLTSPDLSDDTRYSIVNYFEDEEERDCLLIEKSTNLRDSSPTIKHYYLVMF